MLKCSVTFFWVNTQDDDESDSDDEDEEDHDSDEETPKKVRAFLSIQETSKT